MPSTFSSLAIVSDVWSSSVSLARPEVEQLHRLVPVQQAVGRLDVAVDQAHLVGVLQAVGDLGDVVGGRFVSRADRSG